MARVILGRPVPANAPYADQQPGLDPNREHPPLAKLLIAGSMRLFGDNSLGWRLPSIVVGTLSVLLLYGIVRRVNGSESVALLASFLYGFDNLVFVHSRIATLDIFFVAFLLLGIYCYLSNQTVLAALAFVAASLAKISGIYGLVVIVLFEGLRFLRVRVETGNWSLRPLRRVLILMAVYILILPASLGVLDHWWSSYDNPLAHLRFIFDYGFALTRQGGPQGQESNPWQWLVNEVPMTYLRVDTQVLINNKVEITRALIFFRGAMNPFVIAMTPLAIAYALWRLYTHRDDYSMLVLAVFVGTYLPFWPAAIFAHRISYIFYFLPTIPAVAMGAAQLMYAPQTPRVVRWAYVGAVLLGFYEYFPFRL